MRPFHCTSAGLTSAITPNVGNSTAYFVRYGELRSRSSLPSSSSACLPPDHPSVRPPVRRMRGSRRM